MTKFLKKFVIFILVFEAILNPIFDYSKTQIAFAQDTSTSSWEMFNVEGQAFIETQRSIWDPDYEPISNENENEEETLAACYAKYDKFPELVREKFCKFYIDKILPILIPVGTKVFEIKHVFKAITELTIPDIIADIFTAINNALAYIAGLEIVVLTYLAYPTTFRYATAPFVHSGWFVSLQIANAILVLALIYLAIKFILGIEKFGDFKSILNVIIVALILNFSLTICALVIELSNVVTLVFLNSAAGTTETLGINNLNEFSLVAFGNFSSNFVSKFTPVFHSFISLQNNALSLGVLGQIISGIVLTLFSLALIIILANIVFGFFTRVLFLWILLILVPLALVVSLFTSGGILKGPAMKAWIGEFSKKIVFGPVMAFFLMLTFLVMKNVTTNEYIAEAAVYQVSWIQFLMQPAIMLGLLIAGLTVTNSISGNSMKWAYDNIDKFGKWASGIPVSQGKKVIQGIGTTISTGVRSFANSKTGENIEKWGDSATEKAKTVPVIGGIWGGIVGATAGTMSKSIRSMRTTSEKRVKENVEEELKRIKTLENEQVINLLDKTAGRSSTQAQALLKATLDDPVKKEMLVQFIKSKSDDEGYKLLTDLKKTAEVGGIEFKPEEINSGVMFRKTPETDPNYLKYANTFVDKDPDGFVKYLRDQGATTPELFKSKSKDLADKLKQAGYKEGADNIKKVIPIIEDDPAKQAEIWESLSLSQKRKVPKEIAYTEILPNISSDIKELTNFVKARQQEIRNEKLQADVAYNVVEAFKAKDPTLTKDETREVLDKIEKVPYFVSLGITDEIKKLTPRPDTQKSKESTESKESKDQSTNPNIHTPFE